MKRFKLDPAEYDFVWKVNNFDYFFFSIWLYKEYRERDILFTNVKTKNGGEWEMYIGKEERNKTSEIGYRLMKNSDKLKIYKNNAYNHIKKAKKYFKYLKNFSYSRLSNEDLADELIKIARFVNNLWRPYFVTEYFCYDRVDEILRNNAGNEKFLSLLRSNVKKMQKIKFDLRAQLNKTVFGNHIFLKMLKENSKRTGIRLPDLYKLGYLEIVDLLLGKKIKPKYKENYIIGKFSNWELVLNNDALRLIKGVKDYLKRHVGNILHGSIGTTGPEMILACKKAGAIVTEEGGITSHAAIVSRELGIPAVIGTKVATEVLKNGDLVEVDANRGVVKILKRA